MRCNKEDKRVRNPDPRSLLLRMYSPAGVSYCRGWMGRLYCNIRRESGWVLFTGVFVKWRFRSFWKHSVGLRDLGSATVCLCSGQAGDGLPPASYQHTLSVCVSVFKSCKGRDSEIRGEVGKRRMNSDSIVLSSHLGWYSSLFVLLLLTF